MPDLKTDSPNTNDAGARRRDRSPNYPALTISEAISKAKLIWEADRKSAMPPNVAAVHLGFKNERTGSAAPVLSALRKYGLLETVGNNELRISDDASRLFIYSSDSPEYLESLQRLAMKPPLFREVLADYPDGLPSDATLRAKLQDKWEFGSSDAADTFIRALRVAYDIAKTSVGSTSPQRDSSGNGSTPEEPPRPPTQPLTAPPHPAQVMQTPRPAGPPMAAPAVRFDASAATQVRSWDLGSGMVLTLTIPGKLTKKNFEKLKKYVAALELEASIAWDEDESSG